VGLRDLAGHRTGEERPKVIKWSNEGEFTEMESPNPQKCSRFREYLARMSMWEYIHAFVPKRPISACRRDSVGTLRLDFVPAKEQIAFVGCSSERRISHDI
jgi:hypothetical protein